jgi:hypothetical protein
MTPDRPNNRIDAALSQVAASLHETIRIAEERAEQAEAELDEMVRIFTESKAPTPQPKPQPQPTSPVYYPDSLFLNALTGSYQSARTLHNKLRSSGVSKASIYARFQRLANDPKSGVEGQGYHYRRKASVVAPVRVIPPVRKVRGNPLDKGRMSKPTAVTRPTPPATGLGEITREFWSNGLRVVVTVSGSAGQVQA